MKKEIFTAIKLYVLFSIVLGLLYPLGILFFAQKTAPYKANGSLLKVNGKIVGSKLIAQNFSSPKYFHPRPSFVDYDATNSGGSNLSLTNKELYKITKKRVEKVRKENNIPPDVQIPPDMVLASGSGLDPHISVENAKLQIPRIAKERHITETQLIGIVKKLTEPDLIGIWGQQRLNVLKINIVLDKLESKNR